MSKGALGFLVFLVGLVLALAVLGWALGAETLRIMLQAERREQPLLLLQLTAPLPASDADALLLEPLPEQQLHAHLRERLQRLGGTPLWLATTEQLGKGSSADNWPFLSLLSYPSGKAFVERLDVADLRNYTGQASSRMQQFMVLAAHPLTDAPFSDAHWSVDAVTHLAPASQEYPAWVLRLLRWENSAQTPLAHWSTEDEPSLHRYGGALLWQAHLRPLVAHPGPAYDSLILLGFPTHQARADWLADPAVATSAVLRQRLLRHEAVLLLQPQRLPAVSTGAPTENLLGDLSEQLPPG